MTRRRFLAAGGIASVGATLARGARGAPWMLAEAQDTSWPDGVQLDLVERLPDVRRTWIGPSFWANRLQDWRLQDRWIECRNGAVRDGLRSVAILSRELVDGAGRGYIEVRMRLVEGTNGFGGFLIGAGSTGLDWRAAALCHAASGEGGGLLCTYETDGRVRFREHTDENQALAYGEIHAERPVVDPAPPASEVVLRLMIVPHPDGAELRLSAMDAVSGALLDAAIHRVGSAEIRGTIALVSCARGSDGTRYSFRSPSSGGDRVRIRSGRKFGPILGTMYSLDTSRGRKNATVRLTAQIAPVGPGDPSSVRMQYRPSGREMWSEVRRQKIARGFTATFRIDGWDATRSWDYRISYGSSSHRGVIRADRGPSTPLRVGVVGCLAPVGRPLDSAAPHVPRVAGERHCGRYTPRNFYFPHEEIVTGLERRDPDLLVFNGDQIYEFLPTRDEQGPAPVLDYLYKWFLFVWSFRELTANIPSIVQVDDHDVYHPNLWGEGGGAQESPGRGGYRKNPEWVNLVQRVQCAHNPVPYDRTPVEQGIRVYYTAFVYGGVSFAVLEDRKWKTGPGDNGEIPADGELLGARQEAFLEAWRAMHPKLPKVALTQTLFASFQTTQRGTPAGDPDSNGVPVAARDRAVRLLRGTLVISGDQHLPSITVQGLDTHDDGPLQFSVPAGANYHLRWFEPSGDLPNGRGFPHTGDWRDAFGNKLRSIAVANPRVTQADFRSASPGTSQMHDRDVRGNDGFALVVVDHSKDVVSLHCWPYDADRTGMGQFPGWPYEPRA